jgi:hypothetical protein
MDLQQQAQAYADGFTRVVTRAWTDDEFKVRLIAEPDEVLRENGIDLKPGTEVRVVENTDKVVHVGLPPRPKQDELSIEELEAVAGGGSTASTAGSVGTVGTFSCPAGTAGSAFCAGSAGTL